MNNYKVKYYGHSAYSVETENHFLLFDYVGNTNVDFYNEQITLSQKTINFKSISKPITMFHSHTHFDHYSPKLHTKLSNYDNIFTIVGEKIKKYKNSTYLIAGDSININGIQIFAVPSTDIGVCFVLKVDGITIYYAGDNIDWGDSEDTSIKYISYINDIATSISNNIDIAFVPVCNFHGQSYPELTNSAIYACKKLNAKEIYPMHSQHSTRPYVYFKQYCQLINADLNVVIPQ